MGKILGALKAIGGFIGLPFKKGNDALTNATRKKPKTILLIIVSIVSLFSVDAKVIKIIELVGGGIVNAIESSDEAELPPSTPERKPNG